MMNSSLWIVLFALLIGCDARAVVPTKEQPQCQDGQECTETTVQELDKQENHKIDEIAEPRTCPSDDANGACIGLNDDSGSYAYVIGDLHGDAECAKFWVDKLGVVDSIESPSKWLQPGAVLIFMGDYIDKGPTSRQTLEFVKRLTDAFPDNVVALMGNHEMELLKDRHKKRELKYLYYPYAVVHPEEYLNFLHREPDETDTKVVDLLFNVSLEVYANGWQRAVMYAPEVKHPRLHAVTELIDVSMKETVRERLTEYQAAYLNAFMSTTELGQWLEQRPVAHIHNGVFYCHGGLSEAIVNTIRQFDSIDELNKIVRENSGDQQFLPFLESTSVGTKVAEMLLYRDNHKDGACQPLRGMLESLQLDRLAVGHTPGPQIRSMCDGQFLALDSLLGRWIRTSGNYYCPRNKRVSQTGAFTCDSLADGCYGQVIRIDSGGEAEIIDSGK